ncbi:MAG: metallophosphoesterase [Patescibacteria group bacterium]
MVRHGKYTDESLRVIIDGFLASRKLYRYDLRDCEKIRAFKTEIIEKIKKIQKEAGWPVEHLFWDTVNMIAKRFVKEDLERLGRKDVLLPLRWTNKEKKYLEADKEARDLKEYTQKILRLLRKQKSTVAGLSKKFNKSKEFIINALDNLKNDGYLIEISEKVRGEIILAVKKKNAKALNIQPIKKNYFRFMVLSSTHIGNKYQQLSLLNKTYQIAEELGVDFAIHAGDLVAGRKTQDRADELFLFSAQEQIDYAVKHYPYSKNFKTYIIAGKEDLSWKLNVVSEICKKRADLIFTDEWSYDFSLKNFKIKVVYPRKGVDRPYTLSYRLQQIAKSIAASVMPCFRKEGAKSIPRMVFTGKFMAQGWVPRGFGNFMVPGFLAQTPSLEAANISPSIGAIFVELEYDKNGNLVHNSSTVDFWDFSPYIIQNDYGEVSEIQGLSDNEASVYELVKHHPLSVGDVSRRLNFSTETIVNIVDNLWGFGCDISIPKDTKKITVKPALKEEFVPPVIELKEEFTCGSVSDAHIGSKYQQPSIIESIYDFADKKWKAQFMISMGDNVDGQNMYRTQNSELFALGADRQVKLLCHLWPKKNFITFLIAGNHDESFWASATHDVVGRISDKRPDLYYLGEEGKFAKKAIFYLDKDGKKTDQTPASLTIYAVHPRGGSGQFRSYKPQKHVENLIEYVLARVLKDVNNMDFSYLPHLYEMGHWHVAAYVRYMGVDIFLNPSSQAPTPFMEELGLTPDIGAWMKKISLDKFGNVVRMRLKYLDMIPYVKQKDYT